MVNSREDLAWELIRTEHVVQNEWIDLRACAYRFPNGRIYEPFYVYSKRDYVVIVATDEAGNYLCVRQFRQGIGEVTTEFPAGGLEHTGKMANGRSEGRSTEADALEAAKRELLEETGCVSDDWTHLITLPSNATISDNYVFLYRARNCRSVSSQRLDETEFLNVERLTPEELESRIRSGRFQQCDHVLGWYMAREREHGEKDTKNL